MTAPESIAGLPVVVFAAEHRKAICYDQEDTGGYFLFGCDEDWNTVTDSWHESLDLAVQQVDFEIPGARLMEPTPNLESGDE